MTVDNSDIPRIKASESDPLSRLTPLSVMLFAFATSIPVGATGETPPLGALQVIGRVNRAAKQMDYAALRADMIQEFSWSFGGDSSAEQAIAEWKKQPKYSRQLGNVTQATCARKDKYVECPANAGTSFRAGFKPIEGRWKMVYFIGGD